MVIDINILVSALIVPTGHAAQAQNRPADRPLSVSDKEQILLARKVQLQLLPAALYHLNLKFQHHPQPFINRPLQSHR